MVNGKELEVDIMPEERKDDKPAQRSVVDISAECFYPTGGVNPAPVEFPEAIAAPEQTATPQVMASY